MKGFLDIAFHWGILILIFILVWRALRIWRRRLREARANRNEFMAYQAAKSRAASQSIAYGGNVIINSPGAGSDVPSVRRRLYDWELDPFESIEYVSSDIALEGGENDRPAIGPGSTDNGTYIQRKQVHRSVPRHLRQEFRNTSDVRSNDLPSDM